MYYIDEERYGNRYDNTYNYYFVTLDEDGNILEKVMLPKHIREIAPYVSKTAIVKWYLEGCGEVKFKVEEGVLRSERTSLFPGGIKVDLDDGQFITIDRDYNDTETVISLMRDIEIVFKYNGEIEKA